MADHVGVKVTGTKLVIENIEKQKKKIKAEVSQVLVKTGFDVERLAKKLVPVQYGRLKSSISTVWTASGRNFANKDGVTAPPTKLKTFTVKVGTSVKYAHMQEFGHWGDAPKPNKGEYPSRRKHTPRKRPSQGFLYMTRSYKFHAAKLRNNIRRSVKV